jgi:NADP-dependent 3-hydroxy acid dehydrogenase YdfG
MNGFAHQGAIVTGASSGIGRSIAIALAEEGAAVYMIARDERRLEACASEVRRRNPDARTACMDLTDDQTVRDFAAKLQSENASINVLVHSSGAYRGGRIESLPVEDLDLQYRVNVRAPYVLTQLLLPLLKATKGQIVFINSTQGLEAGEAAGAFAATQHALKAIADSLRKEVNDAGIRVITIFPGRTATPRVEKIFALEGKPFRPELLLQPQDVAEMVRTALLAPRTAEITEISMRPMLKSY